MIILTQSTSARILGDRSPGLHVTHHSLSFFMQDVLSASTHPGSRPAITKVNDLLPFSKPLGLFPPSKGIPLPEPNPTLPVTGVSSQILDLSGISLSYPVIATLQELEFGTVTAINENFAEGPMVGSPLLGKTQGIYVASSEDGSSHMMAMTAMFANSEFKDSLRFFGVHRTDVSESHIAVIGGTGEYSSANGYATVKAITVDSNGSEVANKLLLFTVYLSY
ncbi:hypothetical protein HHK36_010916 [Tetracentron sinense]|uniref:Dirigent protein n=1 Tax=Tetracentron sinense TaxID=13715 RepID=A0A834ZBD9_TETSI|nr:hypothetical protein HHK36_010916 [Tetracentron sinense]